jgi:hypothetical protein
VTTGLTDTHSPARTRTLWILSSFPDEYGTDFPEYPVVTIETDTDGRLISVGASSRAANITANITVYSKKASDLDTLTDDIINQIYVTGKTTEQSGNLFAPSIGSANTQTVFREKDKIHIRTIPFGFKWVG